MNTKGPMEETGLGLPSSNYLTMKQQEGGWDVGETPGADQGAADLWKLDSKLLINIY